MLAEMLEVLELDDDRELLRKIYQQDYDKMMRTALNILHTKPAAEDAVHDAFLKVLQHMEDVRAIPQERRIYWLTAVTKNAALDLLRKSSRELPLDDTWAPSVSPDLGEFERMVELIRQMPETYRRVLELRFVAEWSLAEIAEELHLTVGAVKTRLFRGRSMLAEQLKKEGYADV